MHSQIASDESETEEPRPEASPSLPPGSPFSGTVPQGGKGWGASHTDANRSKPALMRERVGAQLELDDQGTRQSRLGLARGAGRGGVDALDMLRRAVARARP